jgi:hypothetical protein
MGQAGQLAMRLELRDLGVWSGPYIHLLSMGAFLGCKGNHRSLWDFRQSFLDFIARR